MPARKAIKAVLHNFLGTYTSRYSDHDGYWLFGLMVDKFDRLEFDLLGAEQAFTEPILGVAAHLAIDKFTRQLALAGFRLSSVREARLTIAKLPGSVEGQVNARLCTGRIVRLVIEVVSDHGKRYADEKRIFVAPHDPTAERRRAC